MKPAPDRRHKYIVIRDWLSAQISSGAFARGEQIPSEHDIMERFGVSRVTARQAFTELRNAGLIDAKRGKGYFVSHFAATANLERLQGFGEMMAALGIQTSSEVLELAEYPAEAAVGLALELAEGALVTKLVRTRNAGGRTVAISINQFPVKLGRKVMCLDLARHDLYVLLESKLGIELAYADTTLDVARAGPMPARYLGMAEDAPVMRITRVTFDSAGRPLVHECSFSALEAMKFRIRVPRW